MKHLSPCRAAMRNSGLGLHSPAGEYTYSNCFARIADNADPRVDARLRYRRAWVATTVLVGPVHSESPGTSPPKVVLSTL